jgi:hypothetical protein
MSPRLPLVTALCWLEHWSVRNSCPTDRLPASVNAASVASGSNSGKTHSTLVGQLMLPSLDRSATSDAASVLAQQTWCENKLYKMRIWWQLLPPSSSWKYVFLEGHVNHNPQKLHEVIPIWRYVHFSKSVQGFFDLDIVEHSITGCYGDCRHSCRLLQLELAPVDQTRTAREACPLSMGGRSCSTIGGYMAVT